MQVTINALMGRGYDATPAIALTVNKDIYLFNMPPLIYRACLQNNIKFRMIKAIFLTSNYTYSCGGLQQFFENISTCSTKQTIFGPRDLTAYMIHNESIIGQSKIYSYISTESSYRSPTINVEKIEMTSSLSYIITIDIEDLKMKSDKMKELNLPPGPWISKVKTEGEMTINGITIKKDDIFFVKHSHFRFLFLDIHDFSDLLKMPSQEELKTFDIIIHFTFPDFFNEKYFNFFTDCKNYCFVNDPLICLKNANEFYSNFTKSNSSLFPPLIQGHITSHPSLPPNFTPFYSNATISSQTNFKLKEIGQMPIITAKLPQFSTFAITIVGSSGAYENPTRSCSGYLIHTHEGYIVIDCGNGFIQQLSRKYGDENVVTIIKDLKCVWLSHCHFDHIIGIYDLLFYRKKLTNSELLICCDPLCEAEIKEKQKIYGKGNENFFHLIFNDRKKIIDVCGIEIKSIGTIHTEFSMGCVMNFKNNGLKLTYTGDMFYDDKFINEVGNCDILISEATYPKDKADRCSVHQHMSNVQAESLQTRLNASYLIMVHTSNLYAPEDYVINNKNAIYGFDYLCIADDKIQEYFDAIRSVKIDL